MSEELIKNVQAMLKEESWTRAAISGYTKSNIDELAAIVQKAREENCTTEIKALCDEHLSHSKDSIIALYISGILSLKDNNGISSTSLENLIEFFKTSKKAQIVMQLCNLILDEDENNKFALRTLADCYKEINDDRCWELYEKFVRLDFEEADLAKTLAERYEKKYVESKNKKDFEATVDYYKKALLRYVNAKNISGTKEIWSRLVKLVPNEIDFFLLVQRKFAKTIDAEHSVVLLQELYTECKDNKNWDTAISLIKMILEIEPKDSWARKEITSCYKEKYKGHSMLDAYIRSSDLNSNYRNVFEAINDFEKHIAFDTNNWVYHKTWAVGKILKVQGDMLTIQFATGKKEMSLKMAVDSLEPLEKDHIWVLKATKSREWLRNEVKENKVEMLKKIIKSFGNSCDLKKIKSELVSPPIKKNGKTEKSDTGILTAGEWTSWSAQAKEILSTNPIFGVNPNDINQYIVRDHEISIAEKYSNEFKAQKQFFDRIDIIMKYVEDDSTDKENDLFSEMYKYFTNFLKTITKVTEQTIASYLVVQKIGKILPQIAFPCKYTFAQLYAEIDNPCKMYEDLKDKKSTTLREDFIKNIKLLPDWCDQYVLLFPTVLKQSLLKEIENAGVEGQEKLKKLVQTAFNNFKDYREAVLFMFENCQKATWFKDSGVTYERELIALLNIIDLSYREINNHLNTTENKKIEHHAEDLLFKKNTLLDYILSNDLETVTRMYTLVDDIVDLPSEIKSRMRTKILEKYPDYKFHTTEEKSSSPKGTLVTAKKKVEKEVLLDRLVNIDIPANAKEIEEAKEKGDLKENSEYKSAKEHQHYLNNQIQKLQEGLNRCTVFDPSTRTTAYISFATKVTLLNKDTNSNEVYTLLGPWESDTENGIISYMSPFGNAMLDKKVNEDFSYSINENTFNYKVISIESVEV